MNTVSQFKSNLLVNNFPWEFKFITRDSIIAKDSDKEIVDVLAKTLDEFIENSLTNLTDAVKKYNPDKLKNALDKAAVANEAAKTLNPSVQVPLGSLISLEDVNRHVDCAHVIRIIENFNIHYVQNPFVTETKSKDGSVSYSLTDGQHTAVAIASMVIDGRPSWCQGYNETNWKDFMIWVSISPGGNSNEDSRDIGRQQNYHINNDKRRQSDRDKWVNSVLSAKTRPTEENLKNNRQYEILKQYGVYYVSKTGPDKDKPGALTSRKESLGKITDSVERKENQEEALHFVLKYYEKYWSHHAVDGECFGFYLSMYKLFKDYEIDETDPATIKFIDDISATAQRLYGNMKSLKTGAALAYKKLFKDSKDISTRHVPYNVGFTVIYQSYSKLGGTFVLPMMNAAFENAHTNLTLLNYLDINVLFEINSELPKDSEKIKHYTAVLPAPKKATVTKVKKPLTVVNG
jgi:hypothetical protein